MGDFRGLHPTLNTTPMAATARIRFLGLVCLDGNGRAVAGADSVEQHCIGFARTECDNLLGADDATVCESEACVRDVTYTGTKPVVGGRCYVSGPNTVSGDAVDGSANPRGLAGVCAGVGTRADQVAVYAGPHVGPVLALF